MIRYCCVAVLGIAASLPAVGAEDSLPAAVVNALHLRQVPGDATSIYIEDLRTGEVILRWNESVPRNPGSTIKLLTTLVALDVLGPAYTWQTDVYALGEVANGKLNGDLLLKGNGDSDTSCALCPVGSRAHRQIASARPVLPPPPTA